MKFIRKNLPLIIAVVISLIAGRALLTTSHFHTHDDLQVFRLNEYLSCIDDGQLPCRWSGELGKGYGYPYFIFYPPLIYAIPAIIHLVSGISLITSLNLAAFLTFPLAAAGMYLLIKELTRNKHASLVASIIYTLVPYHALNIFVRGVYAENLAWAILPYLFLYSYKLIYSNSSIIPLTLTSAALLLTHNISSMLMLPLITLWVIVLVINKKDFKALLKYALSIALALGLSAFFFLSAILEKSSVQTDSMVYGYYSFLNHFVSFKQIFLSNYWGFGGSGFGTEYDEMSFAIGFALTLGSILLTPLALLSKKLTNLQKSLIVFFPLTGVFTLLMMHNKSTPIWELFPLLSYIQFPWRLLGIASTLLVIGIGYNLSRVGKSYFLLISLALLALTFYTSRSIFQPESYDDYQDQDFISGKFRGDQQTAHIYDYLPATVHSVPDEVATSPVFHTTSGVEVISHKKTSSSFTLTYLVEKEQSVTLALYFYPGWTAKLDQEPLIISPDSQYGFVTFNSPKGEHELELVFTNTWIRTASNLISIFSLGSIIGLFLMYNKRR